MQIVNHKPSPSRNILHFTHPRKIIINTHRTDMRDKQKTGHLFVTLYNIHSRNVFTLDSSLLEKSKLCNGSDKTHAYRTFLDI
jgi:hypothetical protein